MCSCLVVVVVRKDQLMGGLACVQRFAHIDLQHWL